MSAPLLKLVREVVHAKLLSLGVESNDSERYHLALLEYADEISRNVMQALMGHIETSQEAVRLLRAVVSLLDDNEFRSTDDQAVVVEARAFLVIQG